jgi:acyl-CoA synthetase (AMP-forming)/AMP-acid ligase II
MNIGESLPRNAQRFPNKLAIVDSKRSLTFLDFHLRTNRLAHYFLKLGIRKGDTVGLSCGSRAEHFEAIFALAKIGAIPVPFDYHWSAQECEAMVHFFAPVAFILEGRKETQELANILRGRLTREKLLEIESSETIDGTPFEEAVATGSPDDPDVEVDSKDTFIIMITSGTTGFPKACTVNHEAYTLRSLNFAITRGTSSEERALMVLPVHFNAGRNSVIGLLYMGATVFIQERFDEQTFLETVQRERITYTILVPTLCERLLRYEKLDQFDKSSLNYLSITGGHLSGEAAGRFYARVCPRFYEAYASTDCGQVTVLSPEDRIAHGHSVGKPVWCVRVKIADDDGRELPLGAEGEICLRTPFAIQGYYRNPQATQEFLRNGWCHTGDIGFLDEQGYLTISGRKKNMIKSGGISVFPEEIEATLRKHPAVMDVAVIGFKSAEWGEAAKAFVVLNQGTSCAPESLIKFCKESLASYKAPKVVEFLITLPRTGLGKIDRGKLEMMNQETRPTKP